NFAPRVMLSTRDLAATGLSQDGARVTHRLQVAAPGAGAADLEAVAGYQRWLAAQIAGAGVKGVRIESLASGRPEMSATLERADRFLSLVGLLSAMLAAV
ncbi:ABC transporter permease, partial [Flavobacterium cupreum]